MAGPCHTLSANSSDYTGQGAQLSAQELGLIGCANRVLSGCSAGADSNRVHVSGQVAAAEYWMQQNKNLTGSALMQAVNIQSWHPSVKALTQFSSVRATWQNISCTSFFAPGRG